MRARSRRGLRTRSTQGWRLDFSNDAAARSADTTALNGTIELKWHEEADVDSKMSGEQT